MPEPILHERNAYLQRVADRLPFDQAERIDVLRELAVHMSDSIARLEADGLTRDAAERAAIELLGPPDRLADALTEARRSPGRLMAAAGAGTWAAVGGAVYGYFFAILIVAGVAAAMAVLAASPLRLFDGGWGSLFATTTVTLVALAVGGYVAGRKVTATAAARSGYRARETRYFTSAFGGGVVLAYALIGWRGPLDWPNAILLLSLPVWFVAGAWHASDRPFPTRRWRLSVLVAAAMLVPAVFVLGSGSAGGMSGGSSFRPPGSERIARPEPASIADAIMASGGPIGGGLATINTTMGNPAVLAGWTDLRVEAWRGIRTDAEYPGDWPVDPTATHPFATAPAVLEGEFVTLGGPVRLGGTVSVGGDPNTTLAWLAITGVAPDGQRYLIDGLSFTETAFNGTGLEWLLAVTGNR